MAKALAVKTTSAPDNQVWRITQGINGRARPKINTGVGMKRPARLRDSGREQLPATPRRNFRLHRNRATLKAAPHRNH
jgi:hypothetical protein